MCCGNGPSNIAPQISSKQAFINAVEGKEFTLADGTVIKFEKNNDNAVKIPGRN